MSISVIAPMIAHSTIGGFDVPLLPYNETTSAQYKIGAVLTINNGYLSEASDADPTIQIVGVAVQPGQNLGTAIAYPGYGLVYPSGASSGQGSSTAGVASAVTPLLMVPALPHVIFEATLANEGSDSAIATTVVWEKAGIAKDSTSGYWYVDIGDTTTNASCLIIGIKNPQDLTFGTTVGARVYFTFLAAQTAWGLAS